MMVSAWIKHYTLADFRRICKYLVENAARAIWICVRIFAWCVDKGAAKSLFVLFCFVSDYKLQTHYYSIFDYIKFPMRYSPFCIINYFFICKHFACWAIRRSHSEPNLMAFFFLFLVSILTAKRKNFAFLGNSK